MKHFSLSPKAFLRKAAVCLLLPALAAFSQAAAVSESADAGEAYTSPAPQDHLPEGFVYVRDLIPDVIEDLRYFSPRNFTGAPVEGYNANTAILTREAAQALSRAADIFREAGYRIKIWDAYRPRRSVKSFMEWARDPDQSTREEYYPDFSSKQALVDQGYIARNSPHMKGSALDMTLTDSEGNELDMGTGFDFFGKKAWHGAAGLTREQKENRELLRSVMEQCGFKSFEQEWWHYRLKNQPYPDTNFDFSVE